MKYIGWTVTVVTVLFLGSIWRGYVLSILWAWFIQYNFPAAPVLSIPSAIGIGALVGWLTDSAKPDNEKPVLERFVDGAMSAALLPAFMLFFGYIVHLFM